MFNRDTTMQQIYDNVAKLGFADLVLINAQISEHMHNCMQHYKLLHTEEIKNKPELSTEINEQRN